jgi:hypothetical protein
MVKETFWFRENSMWAVQRADDRKFLEEMSLERALAFGMDCHNHLGKRFLNKNFNADLVLCIGHIEMNGL